MRADSEPPAPFAPPFVEEEPMRCRRSSQRVAGRPARAGITASSRAALAITLLLAAPPARAEWTRGPATDPESGDAIEAVVGTNAAGFSVLFAHDPAGGVRATFRLPPNDRDFLDAARAPRVSIDGGPTRQVPLAAASLTWVAFPVWNGAGEALTGLLREIMEGETLEVTYFLHGGGYKDATLPLDGARAVLAEAFGLRAEVSAEELRQAAELESAILAEADRCGAEKGKKRDRCLDTLRACAAEAKAAGALRACLQPES
jgi:hypothetical protein